MEIQQTLDNLNIELENLMNEPLDSFSDKNQFSQYMSINCSLAYALTSLYFCNMKISLILSSTQIKWSTNLGFKNK
jgi:hypothetical protein